MNGKWKLHGERHAVLNEHEICSYTPVQTFKVASVTRHRMLKRCFVTSIVCQTMKLILVLGRIANFDDSIHDSHDLDEANNELIHDPNRELANHDL